MMLESVKQIQQDVKISSTEMEPSTSCLTLPPKAKYTPMHRPAANAKRLPVSCPPAVNAERSLHMISAPPPSATRTAAIDLPDTFL